MSTARLDECTGWRNGSLGTWSDPHEVREHRSAPGGFTSQAGQDKLLWDAIFSHRSSPGVYADVASNHYKRISNTYFYDACANWMGLCVEPNDIYWSETRRQRSCRLVPTCVSETREALEMLLPDCNGCSWLGGMGGVGNGSLMPLIFHMNGTQIVRKRRRAAMWNFYPPSKWRRISRNCTTLADEFERSGFSHVDFLSLDVEGHEAAVLRGVDWSRVTIDYILCEANCDAELRPRGYVPAQLPATTNRSAASMTTERLWSRPGLAVPFPPRPAVAPPASSTSATLSSFGVRKRVRATCARLITQRCRGGTAGLSWACVSVWCRCELGALGALVESARTWWASW